MDFLDAELKSINNSGENCKFHLKSPLRCAETFTSDTTNYSVPESPIRRRPERKGRKVVKAKPSIKEITKAMRNLEKETRKKLKELETITERLSKLKVQKAPPEENLGSLITQKLLEETCLQGLIFKDIEPVKTIYTNRKFFC